MESFPLLVTRDMKTGRSKMTRTKGHARQELSSAEAGVPSLGWEGAVGTEGENRARSR